MSPSPSGQRPRASALRCRCRPGPLRSSWPPRCTSYRASWALLDHLESHRARGALDHLHRVLKVVSVEVLPLHLDDLTQLLARDPADLLAVRLRRPLLDARRLLEEVDRRRRLEDEGERAVLEDGELHDVDAVGPKRGAHRRGRRRLSGLQLELQYRADLLLAHPGALFLISV